MTKTIILACALMVSACSSGPVRSGPTSLAKGAVAGMWSSKSPDEVNACLERITLGSRVTGQPLRFQALAADPRKTRYATVISIFGDVSSYPDEAKAAAACL